MKYKKEAIIAGSGAVVGIIAAQWLGGAYEDVKQGESYVHELAVQTDNAAEGEPFSDSKFVIRELAGRPREAVEAAAGRMVGDMLVSQEEGANVSEEYAEALAYCAIAGINDHLDSWDGPTRKEVDHMLDGYLFSKDDPSKVPDGLAEGCKTIAVELIENDHVYPLAENG